MGYRSDIRIRITKGDFDNLKKEFAKYLTEHNISGNIFDDLDIYKEHEYTWDYYDYELNEWVDKTAKCVYFGWDDMKWYIEMEDLMDMICSLNAYAVTIIGENDDDIRIENESFPSIALIRKFADECEE